MFLELLPLVIVINLNVLIVKANCPKYLITTSDIQHAWKTSKYTYDVNAKTGQSVPFVKYQVVMDKTEYFQGQDTGVKVIIALKGKTTIIAFRGTNTYEQIYSQVVYGLNNHEGKVITIGGVTVRVNHYFHESFMKLYDDIKPYLMDPTRKYILTGHSLGGSMASILAIKGVIETNIWKNEESSLITFGQPRTGDYLYAKQHDLLIDTYRKLRIVCSHDPIPQLKISLWTAHHHSREIWMAIKFWTRRKYWKVCSREDAGDCSKKVRFRPILRDHNSQCYDQHIMNLPKIYKDKKNHQYLNWNSALHNTCM